MTSLTHVCSKSQQLSTYALTRFTHRTQVKGRQVVVGEWTRIAFAWSACRVTCAPGCEEVGSPSRGILINLIHLPCQNTPYLESKTPPCHLELAFLHLIMFVCHCAAGGGWG